MNITPEVIRICRVNLGMSQYALARRVGVSGGLISAIERGDRPLTSPAAKAIRAAIPLSDSQIAELVEVNEKVRAALTP